MKRAIAEAEVDWTAIRAQCAGGQNVNKFSSAVHLRFDVAASFFKRPTRTRDFVAQILQAPAPFFHRTAWSLRPMASGTRRPG